MNAEALIGTALGTCTLQKLIGQGGMGAVFLAQQSRPRRQVAVKVLLPMAPLTPHQLAAFLERFRRETDAAASLEHPNITPVHEYGERDGVAYLVMPYISGGTLRDQMEREASLPLEKIVNYLDQMAAALDFAHEHGVIHRDIKPANILMTPEGRLLLTDFGLVKIVAEGSTPQVRLTGAGAPVGTPDYMSPEQVIGEEVDARADLYSLGVILYQMVTGATPFQGETPMQIAAQHLQFPPPSPRLLRPDLPAAAEQVILRALAKRPSERYATTQEFASAFRLALASAGIQFDTGSTGITMSSGRLNVAPAGAKTPPALGPAREPGRMAESAAIPAFANKLSASAPTGATGLFARVGASSSSLSSTTRSSMPVPVPPFAENRTGSGLLSRTGKFPHVGNGTGLIPVTKPETPNEGTLDTDNFMLPFSAASSAPGSTTSLRSATGALGYTGKQPINTVKLTGPVKIVQVPVAGQPGRFVTGILPVPPQHEMGKVDDDDEIKLKPWMKITSIILIALLVIGGALGAFWYVRSHNAQQSSQQQKTSPLSMSTPGALATATAQSNIVISDPLSQNIHNWQTTPADVYAFKNGAYHITDRQNSGRATVLQANPFTGPLGYTLTMQEVKGNDVSPNNSFGMIFRFNQQTKGGKTTTTFYSLEVVNTKGGEYQFWKYDDTKGNATSPWTKLWHQNFGKEFRQGQGSNNTFKVFMNGKMFTMNVDGKKVGSVQDGALNSGTIGMIVNLNGTEIAFQNLLLTRN
jgi:serine/threonine protein kinase